MLANKCLNEPVKALLYLADNCLPVFLYLILSSNVLIMTFENYPCEIIHVHFSLNLSANFKNLTIIQTNDKIGTYL